jgi:hypothetical protein
LVAWGICVHETIARRMNRHTDIDSTTSKGSNLSSKTTIQYEAGRTSSRQRKPKLQNKRPCVYKSPCMHPCMRYPRRSPIPEAEIPREQCTIVTRNPECSWHRIVLHRKGNVPSHYALPCTCSTSRKVMRCDVTRIPILHLSIPPIDPNPQSHPIASSTRQHGTRNLLSERHKC